MYKNNKIGIVILNYSDSGTTRKLCESIRNFKSIDEIVVVDNCSPDHSYENLQSLEGGNVIVVKSDRNGGYSYGNNYGARILLHDHMDVIIIANPDVQFEEEFVIKISDDIIENRCDACTGLMFSPEGKLQDFGTHINSYKDDCLDCTLFLKTLIHPSTGSLKDENSGLRDTELLPGSLFAVRASAFRAVGGFDSHVFLYCEERILASKLLNQGYCLKVDTDTRFIHDHSTSISKALNYFNQVHQMFKSRLYFDLHYRKSGKFKHSFLIFMAKYGMAERKLFWPLIKSRL